MGILFIKIDMWYMWKFWSIKLSKLSSPNLNSTTLSLPIYVCVLQLSLCWAKKYPEFYYHCFNLKKKYHCSRFPFYNSIKFTYFYILPVSLERNLQLHFLLQLPTAFLVRFWYWEECNICKGDVDFINLRKNKRLFIYMYAS